MAHVQKYTRDAVQSLIWHNNRKHCSSNRDINPDLTSNNYFLSPEGRHDYIHYKHRLDELYVYNRPNVVTAASWVITAPDIIRDDPAREKEFFSVAYDFLKEKYHEENVIQAVVHVDEIKTVKRRDDFFGRSTGDTDRISHDHMHFLFIPVVPDTNPKHVQKEKVCCNDVLTPIALKKFHDELQEYLEQHGMSDCRVVAEDKNARARSSVSIAELKELTDLREENLDLKERIKDLERSRERGGLTW